MAKPFEPTDEQDDSRLEQQLRAGYAAPEPSAEFVDSLFRSLDEQFVHGEASSNGVARGLWQATSDTQPTATTADTVDDFPNRRKSKRFMVAFAAAASLLVALTVWSNRPAYGWAEMLRALQQCSWIQTTESGEGLNGWISAKGIVAVQSDQQASYLDLHKQVRSDYVSSEKVVLRQPLPMKKEWSWEHSLLAMLARENLGDLAVLGDPNLEVRVLEESWREVAGGNGRDRLIELQVTLQTSGTDRRLLELVFLLDPETNLPISCEVAATAGNKPSTFQFAFPKDGPKSIFSLGVPVETRVVLSQRSVATLVGALPRESETERIIARSTTGSLPTEDQPEDALQNEQSGEIPTVVSGETVIVADKTVVATEDVKSPIAPERIASLPHRVPTRRVPTWGWITNPPTEVLSQEALVEEINTRLADYWQSQGIRPAAAASDAEFVRRVYLDLTGRIPMVSEVYQFMEDQASDRRERLVDDLLERRDHATHLAAVWRTMLLPDGVDTNGYANSNGGAAKFDGWLADRFGDNLPYGQLVSDLLLAEGRVSESGPILFYAALKLNPEELAAKTSRVFLGTRMECAQCHDHPFDKAISQHDFWGFAAYFSQISRPKGKMLVTSSVLQVRDSRQGEVVLPDSEEIVPPQLPDSEVFTSSDDASRRQQLVEWLTSPRNSQFARATVNRVWEQLFGLGLVDPVDDMRADNPAVCPEVLELLSQDFAANGHDLRRLLRALVLSDAYQLSSRANLDEPSQSLSFARMNIKSFTAAQLYDCIAVATQNDRMLAGTTAGGDLARVGNIGRQAFIQQFRAPPGQRTDYHAGIPQALALMHGSTIHGSTDLSSSGLLKSLEAPFFSDEKKIETLFLATLSRLPKPKESDAMLAHVRKSTNDQQSQQALGDVLWALLNSAEFTFIH